MRKKTHEEFEKQVYDCVSNEYSVLGRYVDVHTKILIRHNDCGLEYEVEPNSFLQGRRCPNCAVEKRIKHHRKTTEQFKKEVFKLVGHEYEVKGEYVNTHTKISMFHKKCNGFIQISPHHFLQGKRCRQCSLEEQTKRMTKPAEVFKKEVYDLVGNEYLVLGDYTNGHTKLEMLHTKCKTKYLVTPEMFLRGNRCPACAIDVIKEKQRKPHEQFIADIKKIHGDEYSILSKYINTKTKVLVKHNVCNEIYEGIPSNMLRGATCLKCSTVEAAKKRQKTHEQFVEEVFQTVGDEYTVLGEYHSYHAKVKMKHNKCGNVFKMAPAMFLSGNNRCTECQKSHGEDKIKHWLQTNKMKFVSQYKIKECKNKRPLPFDFAVFDNGSLKCLIEYDGEQHFKANVVFGGKKGFELTKLRDDIKNQYCQSNNINLIRIPYTKFKQIDSILQSALL